MERARIGVVGVGFIGEVHLRALRANARADVRAVVDVDEARLRAMQERYAVPRAYTDLQQMLEREELDGVVIATPDHLHREPVELAAAAGLHILLEKPIATTIEDAERIIAVTRANRVRLQLGFVLRFTAPYRALHQQVESGVLGRITSAYAKRALGAWEARRLAGRCTVSQYLAVHDIDTILWHMGTEVVSVYSVAGSFVLSAQGLDTPDYYWTTLRFRDGATAVVHSHWAMPDAFPNYPESELLLTGTAGSAHLHLAGQHLQVATADRFLAPDVSYGFAFEDAGAFHAEDEHFTACILEGREPLVGGIDGLNTLRVVLAAEESVRSGQPVAVELTPPR